MDIQCIKVNLSETASFEAIYKRFAEGMTEKTLKAFVEESRFSTLLKENDPINEVSIEVINDLIKERPNVAILTTRRIPNTYQLYLFIGSWYKDIVALTDLLDLPRGPENWVERVKRRKEYIDLALKENPLEVFWDYPDYMPGVPTKSNTQTYPLLTFDDYKINTNGILVSKFDNVLGLKIEEKKARQGYIDMDLKYTTAEGTPSSIMVRRARLVASTFIPLPEVYHKGLDVSNQVYPDVVPDHINEDKQDDRFTNFNWLTRGDNSNRSKEITTLNSPVKIKLYKFTISRGDRIGEEFYCLGLKEVKEAGLNKDVLRRGSDTKPYLGVTWTTVDNTLTGTVKRGFDDPSYFQKDKGTGGAKGENRKVIYTLEFMKGPFKGSKVDVQTQDLAKEPLKLNHLVVQNKCKARLFKFLKITYQFETGLPGNGPLTNEMSKWITDNTSYERLDNYFLSIVDKDSGEEVGRICGVTELSEKYGVPVYDVTRMVIEGTLLNNKFYVRELDIV